MFVKNPHFNSHFKVFQDLKKLTCNFTPPHTSGFDSEGIIEAPNGIFTCYIICQQNKLVLLHHSIGYIYIATNNHGPV